MIRYLPLIFFTAVFSVLLLAMIEKPATDAPTKGSMVEQPLPALPLLDKDGQDATIPSGKLTFINVLASWCAPCEVEMPELVALKKAHPNMQFIGIAWNDSPANMATWLKEHGNPFDAVYYDPKGRAAIALGLRGVPESILVDAQGTIRFRLPGILTAAARDEKLTPLIQELSHAPD